MNDETRHFNGYARIIDLNQIQIDAVFNPNHREGNFLLRYLPKNMSGMRVLDLGCGIGATSIFLAERGANVTGIDISPEMIKAARRLAKLHKVSKLTKFKEGDIEKLKYPPQTFDFVIGKSVLHHVNLPKTIEDVYRFLKPGGIALFSDPLAYNPLAMLYDKFASYGLRSRTERRLSLKDINLMTKKFKKVEWIGINISAFLLFTLDFLYLKLTQLKIPLNWFERVEYGQALGTAFNFCDKIDRLLPKIIQLLGWRVVISCRK